MVIDGGDLQSNSFKRIMRLKQENNASLRAYEEGLDFIKKDQLGSLFFDFHADVLKMMQANTFDAESKDITLHILGIMEKHSEEGFLKLILRDFTAEVKKTIINDL